MSTSTPNPDGLHPIVELNFKGVFLKNPFSYNHGINFTFNDHDFSGMTYGECITFLERFMQESIKKLYYCEPCKPLISGITAIANDEDYGGFIFQAYETDGKICTYVDHDGQGIEDWFGSEIEEEDGDDSCIDGDAYEVDLEERTCSCRLWQLNGIACVHSVATISFMNRDVESYVDKMFSSITYMKEYKFRLAPMNGSNLWPATDYTPPLPPVRRTMPGRPATKRKRDATETPNQSSKKSKTTTQTQNKGKEQVKVSKAGKKQKCSLCKIEGHNKRACTLTRPPKTKANRKTKQGVAEALNEDDEGNQANAVNDG
ncbi:unnamed protein product [Lactuca virosa]|uniref:SWIM-type domain-containing protein n=1 Tax=Lactuca virosa TaxID=75947 RepID=A0AAU9NCR4_9ASTR|nr:unnamed protein product [Lactuca virosa]